MDKLLRKNWLVKIISFLIALMLYAIVSTGESPSTSPSSVVVSPTQETTLTQKLNLIYNSSKYVVTGAPQQVSVHLQGSSNLILKARLMTKSAYIDLNGMKPGTYDVKVQTRGFPNDLKVKTAPKAVRITIQRKTSKEFPVAIDEAGKNSLSKNYKIGDLTVNPASVTVTGGEDTIDSIAFVKGIVNLKQAQNDISQNVTLHAYDNSGDPLNVTIEPSAVHVTIPITSLSKSLSLQAETTGNPASGYSVSSIDLSDQQVTVTAADSKTLQSITSIAPLSVSVDGLKSDKTFSVSVPLPDGATGVSPEKVKVTVHIDKAVDTSSASSSSVSSSSSISANSTKKFSNIPVNIVGVGDGNNASFDSASTVDVSVTGDADTLNNLSPSDIQAIADVSSQNSGDSQVPISITVPNGLTATCTPKTLGITIS
ncbi:MAG: CdaR family protein [Sporolactobacillus sp.]